MGASGILNGKCAVIFGACGSIGAAVATQFAAQRAEVVLAGRAKARVEDLAARSAKANARAHADAIDALDEQAVNANINGIVKQGERIDVTFTAVGPLVGEYGIARPATDLPIRTGYRRGIGLGSKYETRAVESGRNYWQGHR